MSGLIIPSEILLKLYIIMKRIRAVELRIESEYHKDEMKTPIHLCNGQEAIAAGMCLNLEDRDYVFSNHRGHGHYIAKNGNLNKMVAELYNREAGCSRGRGGSMHLIDTKVGIMGSSAIVGGGIPLATGAALATKIKRDKKVSVVFFGDGAVEEGAFYESINFAVLKKLPIIYVCENNLYAVCSKLKNRQVTKDIYKRAQGLGIPSKKIDGNDAIMVYTAVNKIIKKVREGRGPYFLECSTYRFKDHHDIKTGVELGYRTQEELDEWVKRCPIKRLEEYLLYQGILHMDLMYSLEQQINIEIENAFEYAKTSALPKKEDVYMYVYK